MTKIKIGKKYKVNACIETVVHMTEERFATLDNTGCYSSWDYDEIDDWVEYVKPDIFDGIKLEDIVGLQTDANLIVGFVTHIQESGVFLSERSEPRFMEKYNNFYEKDDIKSITKLVPEEKK